MNEKGFYLLLYSIALRTLAHSPLKLQGKWSANVNLDCNKVTHANEFANECITVVYTDYINKVKRQFVLVRGNTITDWFTTQDTNSHKHQQLSTNQSIPIVNI